MLRWLKRDSVLTVSFPEHVERIQSILLSDWWQFHFCLQRSLRMKTCFLLCNSEIFHGHIHFFCWIKNTSPSQNRLPSTDILNKARQRKESGDLRTGPEVDFCSVCSRPSGQSQLPSGQWVKLWGIVRMPYVAATWTVTGDWTIQTPVGEAKQHWRKVYLPAGAGEYPWPTWCTSNGSAHTCWGKSTSKFFLTLYFFSFLQTEKNLQIA